MQARNNSEYDRVFSLDEFRQFERLNQNTNSRIPIFFCVDISGSMETKVGFFETRLSLLSKVMRNLLEKMKKHPVLSERAVIGVVTYNYKAVLHQSGVDLGILDTKTTTSFSAEGQTILSLGLRRTVQAIDQYRDSIRSSDVDTFTPILVFMTDGKPVGDIDSEIEAIYREIWTRIRNDDLYVFPVGISKDAEMWYVNNLTPDSHGYQIINENDFIEVFSEIEKLVAEKEDILTVEERLQLTKKASEQEMTKDTSAGTAIDMSDLYDLISKNLG